MITECLPYHPQRQVSDHEHFCTIPKAGLADPNCFIPGRVDALIGVGLLARLLREGIEAQPTGLVAQNTALGWIVFGETPIDEGPISPYQVNMAIKDETNALVRRLWEIDNSEPRPLSAEEKYCEEHYQSTVVLADKRYTVQIPMKPDAQLGDSRAAAMRQFYALENKFKRNPEYREQYVKFMDEYEQLGHMQLAAPLDRNVIYNYIPHHAVAVETKFRTVYNGSANTTNGRSLNSEQYAGPKLLCEL